jgi:hypothetical protein
VSADLIKQLQALLRRWPAEYYPTQPPYPPDFAEALDAQARRIGELERDARKWRDLCARNVDCDLLIEANTALSAERASP